MSGRAVEFDPVDATLGEQLRHAERVDAERVEPVERRVRRAPAADARELLRVRGREPGNVDETDVLELAQRLARLAVVDAAAGVGGDRPDVGLHEHRIGAVDGEQRRVDRGLRRARA